MVRTGTVTQFVAQSGDNAQSGIGDYALIGDCRTAGLVSRDGSLDWLCFPRFDSPSVFAALLDCERGGRFRIRPCRPFRSERHYVADTNVLETRFSTENGSVVLRDLMPVGSEEEKRRETIPGQQVLREVTGESGEIEIEVLYEPRPDYGRVRPVLKPHGALGIWCDAGRGILVLRSELPLNVAEGESAARGRATVRRGDRYFLSLSYEEEAPATVPALGPVAARRVQQSIDWWRAWAARCSYDGPYRDPVVRSALVLKLLSYAPSGAIVAAPTTSLPERLGGERNWDYRYCWLRDASFTIRALDLLRYDTEAEAFLAWMLQATRLSWPELQVVYNVYGETKLTEHELPHLAGHAYSRPVRIGNDAHGQLQMDVYGEVIDAAARMALNGRPFDHDSARLLQGLGKTVLRRWREPDEGIWEGRSGRFQHTHSKVLCWVALDRLIAMHEAGLLHIDVAAFRTERAAVRELIETLGYNHELQSYTRTIDGDDLDASLLTLPLYGFLDAPEPRMHSTITRILTNLGAGPHVYGYGPAKPDGLPPGEGAFGICGFWAVECLANAGRLDAAKAAFEELQACQNDVGLFAEQIDPATKEPLGNFPQAFTHVGLINAALTLARHENGTAERQDRFRGEML